MAIALGFSKNIKLSNILGFSKYVLRTVNVNLWKFDKPVCKLCVFVNDFERFVYSKSLHASVFGFLPSYIDMHFTEITHCSSDVSKSKLTAMRKLSYFDIWISDVFLRMIICNITFIWVIGTTKRIFFLRRFNSTNRIPLSFDNDFFLIFAGMSSLTKITCKITSKCKGMTCNKQGIQNGKI